MKNLETCDWMLLNSIIYKIYTTEDLDEMRREFLEQLRLVVDFDSADFYLAGHDEKDEMAQPVAYNCEVQDKVDYEQYEYCRRVIEGGKSLVYRLTDMIPEGEWRQTKLYREVYQKNNWQYSLQMVVCRNGHFLGMITFYRTIGKEDFRYDDITIVDMLKDHMAYRLEQLWMEFCEDGGKMTITTAVQEYGLTKREETILRLLLAGLSNDEICGKLVISVNTLKKHVLNIYRKLGIRNRVQMFKMIREKE